VLFDRFSPLALLFPRKDALEAVLRELNGTGKAAENEAISAEQFAEIWKADETIGWIYQYYNDEAERKKMRELSSAPRIVANSPSATSSLLRVMSSSSSRQHSRSPLV